MLVADALKRSVRNYPDKLAIKDEYGKHFPPGSSYSYKELSEAVNRLGNSFLSLGLKKGDRVAVQTGTGIGYFLSLFALTKVGMAIAPVDRTFMADEITYQIQDSGARGFIADADIYIEKINRIRSRLDSVDYFIGIGTEKPCEHDFDTLIEKGSSDEPGIDVKEDDIATLIYTSGTTGKPKGVPLTHRNWTFSATVWAGELGIHPYTRWVLIMPMHTSGGTGLSIASVTCGCSFIVTNPDPKKILSIIDREKITFTQFSPTLLANVIRHPDAEKTDFSSIEHWFTSAAPISAELLKEGAKYLGEKFVQLYGTTETALLGTVLRPQEVSVEGPLAKRLTSIGRACLGYQTKVVDDDGNEVSPGDVGELAVCGEAVASGYWNKPEATDFRDGWWYSGDMVQVDEDGFYYVVDRKKDMILTGGLNVYPREVEDVISSHSAVHLVCVIGVPDEKWGEAVKAVVVLKDGAQATEEELIDFCKERVASYKKPKSVDFIDISQMPMRGGGYKILRRELRDRYRKEYAEKKKGESWGAV
ncbi:MAG: AMP-binding protein [Deltaproteobacteria bacterium]|nr:MAG: AMP-binding protein [Deltaproteobacteria bacterium]